MAAKWYPIGVAAMLKGDLAIDANVKIMLVKNTYTYNAAHDFLADVSAHRADADIAVAGEAVTVSSNVVKFDFDDTGLTFAAVTAGDTVNAVIAYVDTGDEATSYLITYNDFTGIPTNGGDITVAMNASGVGTATT